jgi:tripartite-type tricarboxylate transporter receptor subunit TctC
MMNRRRFFHIASSAVALPALMRVAAAQSYPARPLRIVVGFTPGGAADTTMRLIGQWLSERLGQSVIIDNRPGASTNLSVQTVLGAPADGYTLLFVSGSQAINASLYDTLPFEFLRDFVPVASVSLVPLVMVVNPSVPAKTVSEFVNLAKGRPGALRMASFGTGSPSHLAGELFKALAGVDMIHIPYRGSAGALTDLMSGRVEVMFDTLLASGPHIRSGALRLLALTGKASPEFAPGVPALADTLPGYEADGWQGLAARRGTPASIIERLNAEINAGLADKVIRARMAELAVKPSPLTPAAFGTFMEAETVKWARVVKLSGAKPE